MKSVLLIICWSSILLAPLCFKCTGGVSPEDGEESTTATAVEQQEEPVGSTVDADEMGEPEPEPPDTAENNKTVSSEPNSQVVRYIFEERKQHNAKKGGEDEPKVIYPQITIYNNIIEPARHEYGSSGGRSRSEGRPQTSAAAAAGAGNQKRMDPKTICDKYPERCIQHRNHWHVDPEHMREE